MIQDDSPYKYLKQAVEISSRKMRETQNFNPVFLNKMMAEGVLWWDKPLRVLCDIGALELVKSYLDGKRRNLEYKDILERHYLHCFKTEEERKGKDFGTLLGIEFAN